MIRNRDLFLVGLAVLALGLLVSCQSGGTPTLAELSQPGMSVGISDDVCPSVQVKAGDQISWTNQGRQEHIVRAPSDQGGSGFDSGVLQPGDSFELTLTEPDVYEYVCSEDGSLAGTVTVEP